MDALQKLASFNEFMGVEIAEEQPAASATSLPCGLSRTVQTKTAGSDEHALPIHMAALPDGRRIPLLKTLLTSACERNCHYCAFRAGRDFRRQTFSADEMAATSQTLYQKGTIQGLFLSSGLAGGGIRTQDRLIDTVEILRKKLHFTGYIHLKVMPGSEKDQVLRAMQLADRVSVNLEGPNNERLAALAPQKEFMHELLQPLRWIDEIRRTQPGIDGWKGRWPSSTTQFVVGAAGERDLELLRAAAYLHGKLHLARVYFSGFVPVRNTPLEDLPAVDPWRQHRLYQADFLLRDYGFQLEDLPFTGAGDLPLDVDPKLAWARVNLTEAPVDINHADRSDLLRIPGIGPKSAQAILSARRQNQLDSLDDLKALGIRSTRAAPFILLNGRRPPTQLSLW